MQDPHAATAKPNTHSSRIIFLDYLRAVACLLVVFAHLYLIGLNGYQEMAVWVPSIKALLFGANAADRNVFQPVVMFMATKFDIITGTLGVAIFFLISGFVILRAVERESTGEFLIKRIFRIYPANTAVVCLAAAATAIYCAMTGTVSPHTLDGIVTSSLVLNGFLHKFESLPILWTLEVELFFYAMMAFMAWRKRLDTTAIFTAAICNSLFTLLANSPLTAAWFSPHWREIVVHISFATLQITFLCVGSVIYRVAGAESHTRRFELIGAALALFVATRLGFLAMRPDSGGVDIPNGIFALALFSLAMWSGMRWHWIRPLRWIADISYPLYLVHVPIGWIMLAYFASRGWGMLASSIGAGLAVLAMAWLIHITVERWGQRMGRAVATSLFRRNPAAAGTTLPADRTFRFDLNGLRAIAVVSVLLFHFRIGPFSGGFIGVDVFFAISGYLMTQIVAGSLATQRFNLLRFYLNRVARIVPALIVVGLACLAVSYLVSPPEHFAQIARETLDAVTFRVNFLYANTTNYFAPAASQRWLLHCWSLAVEFQFYIVFPLAVYMAHKLSPRRGPPALLGLIIVASGAWSYLQTSTNPSDAFYLLPTRAWEFALGGIVLYLPAPAARMRSSIAAAGLALIVGLLFWYTEQLKYPSLWAALPVLGAMLVLWARSNFVVLTNPVAQYLGTVSYSLYLWHWPLLTIAHYFDYGHTPVETAVLVALTFVMAHLSNRLIENPFRDAFRHFTFTRTAPVVMAGLGIVVACQAINNSAGWPQRLSPAMADLVQRSTYHGQFRDKTCFLAPDQKFTDFAASCFDPAPGSDKPKLAIWGSSHGAHLFAGIDKQEWSKQFDIIQLTASACAPMPAATDPARPHCADIQKGIRAFLSKAKPDVLLIAMAQAALADGPADGPALTSAMLQSTIKSLLSDGVGRVVIVGPVPDWPLPLPQIYFRDSLFHKNAQENLARLKSSDAYAAIDSGIRTAATQAGATYVSLHDTMCQADRCFTKVPDWPVDVLVQFDQNHLTSQASEWLAEHAIGPAMAMPSEKASQPALALNEKLEFHQDAAALKYLTTGWMAPENWGSWTASTDRPGVVTLPIDRNNPPRAIRLRFSAQLADAFPVEHFSIRINQETPHMQTVLQALPVAERVLPISAATQRQLRERGVLRLSFYAPDGRSSKSLGINGDERVLGLGLREITLLP
jgi:peptidoglycan/LPS O-acetylase OafA/YrhL